MSRRAIRIPDATFAARRTMSGWDVLPRYRLTHFMTFTAFMMFMMVMTPVTLTTFIPLITLARSRYRGYDYRRGRYNNGHGF